MAGQHGMQPMACWGSDAVSSCLLTGGPTSPAQQDSSGLGITKSLGNSLMFQVQEFCGAESSSSWSGDESQFSALAAVGAECD